MNIESEHTTVTTRTVDTNYQLAYIKEKSITPDPEPVAPAPATFSFGAARAPAIHTGPRHSKLYTCFKGYFYFIVFRKNPIEIVRFSVNNDYDKPYYTLIGFTGS